MEEFHLLKCLEGVKARRDDRDTDLERTEIILRIISVHNTCDIIDNTEQLQAWPFRGEHIAHELG